MLTEPVVSGGVQSVTWWHCVLTEPVVSGGVQSVTWWDCVLTEPVVSGGAGGHEDCDHLGLG